MIKYGKYGWVDLSNVPKRGKLFNWSNAAGTIIPFLYKDVESYMSIQKRMDRYHLMIAITDVSEDYIISIEDLVACNLGKAVGKIVSEFRYNIGDIVNDSILILSMYKNGHRKCYSYRCLIDGYDGRINEDDLRRGRGCPVCANQKVIQGVNDIATTNKNIASLFLNKEDTHKYTEHSSKRVDFICPRCGNIINRQIYVVADYGLSCKRCGDGISYSEKFVYNFLKQISNIDFDTQRVFDWSKNICNLNDKLSGDKIYDFYIPLETPIIIETHGEQHFECCLYNLHKNSKTLEEEQENDRIKMNIALCNGILHHCYIQLDCRESSMEYIKNSIMNSELPSLLLFTENQIDWDECNRFATSSRVFEVCDLWNGGMHSTRDIGVQTKLDQSTIRKYLRRGQELKLIVGPLKYTKHNKRKTQQND